MRLALALLLAALAGDAFAQAAKPRRKKAPTKSAAPAKKPAARPAPAPAPAPETAAPSEEAEEVLAAAEPAPDHATFVAPAGSLGAALLDTSAGPTVGEPLADSPAEAMGLEAGDRVLSLGGKPLESAAAPATAALTAWPLGARLSAVVARGLETRRLETPAPPVPADRAREKERLSPHEVALKQGRLDAAAEKAHAALAAAPALDAAVHARQTFWVNFPTGVSASAVPGAVFVGETTTAIATSSELDFLSLPPMTRVWARVLSLERGEDVRKLRLHVYKLQPPGGYPYKVSALVTDLVPEPGRPAGLVKVSAGGTLASAAPLAPLGKREKDWLVSPDTRLRAELLETVTLTEAPSYFRAGPGLWLRAKDSPEGRRFELSHVISQRSAEGAGLKVGQIVDSIGARSAAKLEFSEALDMLYGPLGTEIKLTVLEDGGKKRTVSLKRGAVYKDGAESLLPPPVGKN